MQTITETQTTADTTRETECSAADLRAVIRAIRTNGGFIRSSSPCAGGYIVRWTVYR